MNRRLAAAAVAVVLLAALGVFANWRSGRTSEVEEGREFVYYPLVTNGFEYRRTPYPEAVEEIYVLADEPLVLEARTSLVSFWPITKEYLADFAKLDETVTGKLEIDGPDGTVEHEPQAFTFWYPQGTLAPGIELVVGDEAQRVYDDFLEQVRAYLEADREYQRKVVEWQARLEAYMGMVREGVEPLPDPPGEFTEQPPEPYRGYATELQQAPIVTLPAGTYRLRWRDPNGQIVPGSERRLISFARSDAAVGYTVIPEDRWTQPEISFDPAETIYLAEGQDIFLVPVDVSRYNFFRYARVFEPQTIEATDPGETIWIPDLENLIEDYALAIRDGSGQSESRSVLGYRVRQDPGATRGYTIEPFEGDGILEPDFWAVRLPTELPVSEVRLLGPDGGEVPASRHAVKRVPEVPRWALYVPAAAFLAVAVVLWLRPGGRGVGRASAGRTAGS